MNVYSKESEAEISRIEEETAATSSKVKEKIDSMKTGLRDTMTRNLSHERELRTERYNIFRDNFRVLPPLLLLSVRLLILLFPLIPFLHYSAIILYYYSHLLLIQLLYLLSLPNLKKVVLHNLM